MTMVENHAAIQPAAAPASVAAVDLTAVVEAARTVAATTSPGTYRFSQNSEIRKRREVLCRLGT